MPPPSFTNRVGVEYLPPELVPASEAGAPGSTAGLATAGRVAAMEFSGPVTTRGLLLSPPFQTIGHAPIARPASPGLPQHDEQGRVAVTRAAAERLEQLNARRAPFWQLDREELAAVDDQFERMSLRLLQELVGDDSRRLGNEMGARYLTQMAMRCADFLTPSSWTERDLENQDWMFQRYGARLLRRPAVRALRETTVIRDLELALEGFKADNVPLSQPYQEAHSSGSGSHVGHLAIRLRARGGDPVEVTYVRSGWRIGSSRSRFKASYGTELAHDVRLTLQTDYGYLDRVVQVSAQLECKLDEQTRAYFVTGNRMNPLFGPQAFLDQNTLFELAPGIAFFVEHLF